ncbi:MAG TPA: helix-turn-helix domain-containing protein [Acidimicrobiales bacterium]|nr:helix-turn-helix domain-containing protein [Acidimicrobiales bacterium]
MSDRSTLRTLLENLGTGILRVHAAPAGLDVAVGHPVIDDPEAPAPFESGDVVMAVGTRPDSPSATALVARAGQAGASAVLLRDPASGGSGWGGLVAAAGAHGVALLGVVPEMAWSQLHTLLRSAVAAGASSSPETEAAGALGDLFALANAIAAMVGGPTTIEDPQSTVLAYSSLDSPIDEARRRTILGRRVPDEWLQRLHGDGVFRRLWSTDEVIRIEYPDSEPEVRPRLAVAVRAGGEVLGSVWVAEDDRPLDAGAESALREAARIAALHLLRARSGEDLQRSWRSNLLRSLLDGHAVEPLLAESLGAHPEAFATVIAFRLPDSDPGEAAASGRRACRLLDLYCESTRRRGSAVAVGPVVYLLLADETAPLAERLEAMAREMVCEPGHMLPAGTVAAVGPSVRGLESVARSRLGADRVLAVLSAGPGGPVGTIHGVREHAVLLRLGELAAAEPELLEGRVGLLRDHDTRGRGHYVETLRAYLDSFGDVAVASAALDVHPNTFRYRMRRIAEISGIDFDDPVQRLVAHLQLHLGGPAGPS